MLYIVIFAALGLCVMASSVGAQSRVSVIPKPVTVEDKSGVFTLSSDTRILVDPAVTGVEQVGEYLSTQFGTATGFDLKVKQWTKDSAMPGTVLLTTRRADPVLGSEGYELDIKADSVVICASEPAGLFLGVQTLRQLFPAAIYSAAPPATPPAWVAPCCKIWDKPRFKWRGLHLDVSRHFMSIAAVKRYIDLLAMHKMNVFHWHLIDDQGWRIEIESYPRLTEVSAWRTENGRQYGGFYTKNEVREIVKYAADRFITVVPEIEMPGHAVAALAAYPEYSCTGGPFTVPSTWGVFNDVFCAGNEGTFTFLENILTEVFELFPSEIIHIGGDECPKTRWTECSKCQARRTAEGLVDMNQLQSWFITRIEQFVNAHGKRIIGWDEILEGGLAPNAAVMSWRGTDGGIEAAQQGHDVVMSPTSHCYFDYSHSAISVDKVYLYEPVPSTLTPRQATYIMGAQGNLWTESISDQAKLDFQAYPRATALSEVVWTPSESKSVDDFKSRLAAHLLRFDVIGVNYFVDPNPDGTL